MAATIDIPVGTKSVNITQESNRILLEFVPKFKEGDFLYSDAYDQKTILIFKKIYNNNHLYYYACMEDGDCLDVCESNFWTNIDDFRLATEAEQQQLLYMMKKKGKQWNAEKLRIEDIPQRKFKPGDKVKLKDGMPYKREEWPYFEEAMDVFIGKVLTVKSYTPKGHIFLNETGIWILAEAWLEPYFDKPEKGDLAIFWETRKDTAMIRIYRQSLGNHHQDNTGWNWKNAIKFESREQFLEHIED